MNRWCVLVAAGLAVGCGQSPPTASVPLAVPAAKPLPTLEEFREKVVGKTAEEVLAAVGRPETTRDADDGGRVWAYLRACHDPIAGRPVPMVFVRFDASGRVSKVD